MDIILVANFTNSSVYQLICGLPLRLRLFTMEDEPISPFPRFVSGSGRAVTPIKHRTITPTSSSQQNQQTRSISKLKMAQAIIDSQPSEKYISHRKQRKWENANMILLQRILSRKNDVSTLFPDESHTMPGPQRDQARCDFNLLREMDKDPMFSFMRVQGANKSKRIMRDDEWSVEEAKWINNVKKQLRGVVLELLEKKEDLFEYLRSLEMVLWCFMESQSTPAIEDLPSSFLELLTTRPGTEPTRTDSVGLRVDEGKLILPLKDLPLTRLVTFAACQFYGLHTEVRLIPTNTIN